MPKIDKIKNVSVYADLTNTPVNFYFNTNLHFTADEVLVRQISYNGPAIPGDGVYLIWSSIINDYIGSFSFGDTDNSVTASVNVNPNTTIKCLPNSINQSLQFQIHRITDAGATSTTNSLTGRIVILLDFVRYAN